MELIADLHIHSKYAAASSAQMTLENIAKVAAEKGIGLVSTGDFTHPLWFSEIKAKLEEAGEGIYALKGSNLQTRFVLGVEIATISGTGGVFDKSRATKKVHHCVLAPSIEIAEQVNDRLSKYGDLSIDGRPMLNMKPSELVEVLYEVSKEIIVFPAHAWTPWFGVFGSMSGYDSMQEAYEEQEQHIHALETGLSSDPPMNWRVSKLDKYALVSNSDAHSLPKLGREANAIEVTNELTFKTISDAIENKQVKYTIEFYPEEGKYHYDGHRKCGVSLSPQEAAKYHNMCPVCGKPLTLGVLHRVEDLADRPEGYVPKGAAPYVHAVPLMELIAEAEARGTASAYAQDLYATLVKKFGSEFNVLLKANTGEIAKLSKRLALAIENVRNNKVYVKPGYDGVFGVVDPFKERSGEDKKEQGQKSISDF